MRKLLTLLLFIAAPAWAQQQFTNAGEAKTVCQVWDGTDKALVDASGNLMVGDGSGALNTIVDSGTLTCNAGSGTFTVGDGAGALNVIVDSGALTASISQTGSANDVDVLTMPTVTVTDGAGALNTIVDSGTLTCNAGSGTFTVGDGSGALNVIVDSITAGDTNIGNVDIVTMPSVTIGTFPDNEPVNMAQKGGVAVVAGPCEREINLYVQISQTAGAQLITGTASERIYVCSISIVTATAQNIALVDGTGSVCATSPTGLLGGSTAATGQNFAANGGWVLPFNPQAYAKTSTDADNVCLLQSGAGQVSGIITYVSVPNI